MKCPICNTQSEVLDTREGVKRRRQCYNGHRFTTIEAVITSDHKVYPPTNRVQQMREARERFSAPKPLSTDPFAH